MLKVDKGNISVFALHEENEEQVSMTQNGEVKMAPIPQGRNIVILKMFLLKPPDKEGAKT